MKEALGELNKKQIDFICRECSISEDKLKSLSEDELYESVYDVMCDIETDFSDEKRCKMASDIVTMLGNTIPKELGFW